MTTTEQNKAIVNRFNREFIECGNIDAFHEIISPAFQNQTPPPGIPKGPEGVIYFFNNFLKPAFPELKVEIRRQVAEGDMVTTHKVFHTTHRGDFMDIPPTGKNIGIEVMDIIRLKDGKFVEQWNVVDWQHVIFQLMEEA